MTIAGVALLKAEDIEGEANTLKANCRLVSVLVHCFAPSLRTRRWRAMRAMGGRMRKRLTL